VPDRQLDPYFAEFLPVKAGRIPRAHKHVGCEFLYLLTGCLDVRHGEIMHRVDAGDAVYFDANTIHSYLCAGEVPATAVIVTLQHAVPAPQTPRRLERSVATAMLRPVGETNAVKSGRQRTQ